MIEEYPLGEFAPDAADYKNPGLVECENVYALASGYSPIMSLVQSDDTVTGEVRGAVNVRIGSQSTILVVGTDTDLYVYRSGSFTASGLALSLTTDESWSFERFGGSFYASCKTEGMFRLTDVDVDNTFATSGGTPPAARVINAVGDFLMTGNLIDIDASDQPYRIRWSAFNNPTGTWTTDIATQSGYVDMPTKYGEVTAVYGSRFDLIFQKSGISRIWYTGGASVFNKEIIEDDRGCDATNSIVRVGGSIYFLSADGFCRTDGSGVDVISSDRVWKWFQDTADVPRTTLVQGAVDWANRSIIWSFMAEGFTTYNRQIIYNWGLDRWTTGMFNVDWIVQSTAQPPSIDETDPTVVSDDTLDVVGPAFDSAHYSSRGRSLAAMYGGALSSFTGGQLAVKFETGDFQPTTGNKSYITSVLPLVEAVDRPVTIAAAGRDALGDPKAYGPLVAQGPLLFCPLVSDARFHSLQISIPANTVWDKMTSFQIDWRPSGIA